MAYQGPGIQVKQEQLLQTDVQPDDAELPTCLIAPLWHVGEKEKSSSNFDPFGGKQNFSWPNTKSSSNHIDLEAVLSGKVDYQLKEISKVPPKFYLSDDRGDHKIKDSKVDSIDQSSFDIDEDAREDAGDRATRSALPVFVNDRHLFFRDPDTNDADFGPLSDIKTDDQFELNNNTFTVNSSTIQELEVDSPSDILGKNLVADSDHELVGRNIVDGEGDSGNTISNINISSTAGRIEIQGSTSNQFDSFSKYDVVVTGSPASTGMKNITVTSGNVTISQPDIELASSNIADALPEEDVKGYIASVEDQTDGGIGLFRVKSVDKNNDKVVLTETEHAAGGDLSSTTDIEDSHDQDVTIYDSQIGHVTEIKDGQNNPNDILECQIPAPFSYSGVGAWVHIFKQGNKKDLKAFPQFELKVTYREQRQDLVGDPIEAGTESEFLNAVDHDDTHVWDGLGFMARTMLNAQPSNRNGFFVPVDTIKNGRDAGYDNALDDAKSLDCFNIVPYHKSSQIKSDLHAHIDQMFSNGKERRSYTWRDVPLGDTESSTGQIRPGKTIDGTASGPDKTSEGNKKIRDLNVDFVDGAGVQDGTKVVVEGPDKFKGEYEASSSTTNNVLVLKGDNWTVEYDKSLNPNVDPNKISNVSLEIDTASSDTHEITDNNSNVPRGYWDRIEKGDYIELTESGTTYRMRVLSVDDNDRQLTVTDEVAGSLSFSTASISDFGVIRSWGYDISGDNIDQSLPAVDYHIEPLTTTEQRDKLNNDKSTNDRRKSLALDYEPTVTINGTDYTLKPSVALAAVAGKRSGLQAHDPITNLYLGAGITDVKWGFGHFDSSELDELADNGYLLLKQESSGSQPHIRDSVTSSTSDNLVNQEEMVVSNFDWQAKTLRNTFQSPPGEELPRLTDRLLGVRAAQIDSILKEFEEEGRVITYDLLKVERDSSNPRQTNIEYKAVSAVAEKEIEITVQETV